MPTIVKQEQAQRRKALRAEKARAAEEIDEGVADLESSPDEDEDIQMNFGHSVGDSSDSEEEAEPLSRDGCPDEPFLQNESGISRTKRKKKDEPEAQIYVSATEIHAYLVQLFEREAEILRLVYQPDPKGPPPTADMFFVQNLIVPPNKFRKESVTGKDGVAEPPEHDSYKQILGTCDDIWQIRRELAGEEAEPRARLRNFDDLQRAFIRLQDAVNGLFDSSKANTRGLAARRTPGGIKQKLEKKEGMFRSNIMGKRVNFAARSVISPDPNIETNEIGVPKYFAQTLTFPEPVTPWTLEELKKAVRNGPEKWPGANAIENENGQVITLKGKSDQERDSFANLLLAPSSTAVTGARNKKVHRHLNDGDIVIMNRQPTLHKPSMMCHRAKILHGQNTIRMHYANCNTYNADFDGDEMNMHFPQNEFARAEAMQIADTDHQYLSATAGEPLRGLIQDHVTMGTWLTCVDMFFSREEYQQLLFSCIRPEATHTDHNRILMVDPAILKPVPRWTGRQLITTILKNIQPADYAPLFVESACNIPGNRWDNAEDAVVRIIDGEHLTGVLDKKQIGPKSHGLVHSVYEAYGATAAGRLLSILGRLLTRMLNMRAFSCGIEDLLLTDKGNGTRKEKLAGVETVGLAVAAKYVTLESRTPSADSPELLRRLEGVFRDEEKQANLDVVTNKASSDMTTQIWNECLPHGLEKPFPRNQMQTMTLSGAKGTNVNASQISCNLGQQVLEGRRVPVMVSGKTLPSFRPFETNVRAGGYIADRFLTGVRPQEFYFSLMAGREGLIDTAVKTSRSGYLQRCLVKGLEGLRVEHDTSVHDSDGSMIQSLYGEDGLEIVKQQKLMDFKFLSHNYLSLFASLNVEQDAALSTNDDAVNWNKTAIKKVAKHGKIDAMDPVLSQFPPFAVAGSTSEKFFRAAKQYLKENPDKTIRTKDIKGLVTKKIFESMLNVNYSRSVVEPGEAVGVVAAQSIGEPSTQMTLNTFHLAGFAAKNVTLGIPRLRELLMTASKTLKKPTMTLHPIPELSDEDCLRFAKSISRLALAEIIESTSVHESIGKGIYPDSRIYKVRLNFYPGAEYTNEHAITTSDVGRVLEHSFLKRLRALIKKDVKKRSEEKSLQTVGKVDARPELGMSAGRIREEAAREEAANEGGDSDEDAGGDDDATDAKRKANLDEGMTYEDPDESEEEIEKQGELDAADEVVESDDEPVNDEGYGGSEGMPSDDDDSDSDAAMDARKAKDRSSRVLNEFREISAFTFHERKGDVCEFTLEYPTSTPRILLLSIVKRAAQITLIQEIPGLGSTLFSKATNQGERTITTEGTNLSAMWNFTHAINPHSLVTNDIWAMRTHYGVEAARDLIIRETADVFEGHNITVDRRHLTLVADYMTRNGGYLPFSRTGMKEKSSPFAKMSFETTIGFLSGAILDAEMEDLSSPSARITMGKVGKMGSGMCDVLMPVS